MEGVFHFKSWFLKLNALGLIHGGAYYRNFTESISQTCSDLLPRTRRKPGLEENIYWHIMEEKEGGGG